MRPVSSWGRLNAAPHAVIAISDPDQMLQQVTAHKPGLACGNRRSYGDVCLNPGGVLWDMRGLDHLLQFDEHKGLLTCAPGVLLRDIQRLLLPRGWMLPVTPGTQLLTVGGAIANDVHGKNHHVHGSFGDHVKQISLLRTDGQVIACGPASSSDWFAATVGGLGLTGVITSTTLQLHKVTGPWLDTELLPFANLGEFFTLADASEAGWEHTVAWIDCFSGGTGRGLFMRGKSIAIGDRAVPRRRNFAFPFVPPFSLVFPWSVRAFNSAYFTFTKARAGRRISHYEPFLYPLDNLQHWNRMYGPKGFYQYQCLIPRKDGHAVVAAMLDLITRKGSGSFLAVLKTFGERHSAGMLGFPRPGVTLSLDFPNRAETTLELLRQLDSLVRESGGCLYPAKDARMPRDLFEAGYPRLQEFLHYRDPGISSGLSRRLMGS